MKSLLIIALAMTGAGVLAASLPEPIADREAIERVYYQHRTGTTMPFAQALPPADLQRLVARDAAYQQALRRHYGVELTREQIDAEVIRIESTTRAPEILAEIRAALGNDRARFAAAVARPIVVERELRLRFENDDAIHARTRRECETIRTNLLVAKSTGSSAAELTAQLRLGRTNNIIAVTWMLAPRPAGTNVAAGAKTFFFDDLPARLKQVLGVQLRATGDVSAVIETSENFLLFVADEKTETHLTATCLALPKQTCDDWLATQTVALKN